MATSIDYLEKCLLNSNIQAAIKVVRHTEGTTADDGYQYLFTSSPRNNLRFADMSTHPNKAIVANGISSTAAGAFQILKRTYDYLSGKYGIVGFDEHKQNLFFCAILDDINVLGAVCKGQMLSDTVLTKMSGQWASLPYSKYGQPTHTVADVRNVYLASGGSFQSIA